MSVKTSQGDAELLAATRNGDVAAYRVLHQRHAPAAHALARLLHRAETDEEFYEDLKARCEARKHLVSSEREKADLGRLMEEAVSRRDRGLYLSHG